MLTSVTLTMPENVREIWRKNGPRLASWVLDQMVVRVDAFGKYYKDEAGKSSSCKIDGPLDTRLLENHFSSHQIIGLYTTSMNDLCKWITIDFDLHDGDPEELRGVNAGFAQNLYRALTELGFSPLLLDSNGKGGFHLTVLFDEPEAAKDLRSFGLWLVRDWKQFGLSGPPEVFPKQDSIKGGYGNYVRLFGKHPKRDFFSKVWDGEEWLTGYAAIEFILDRTGDVFSLVPPEALAYLPPKPEKAKRQEWWQIYACDLKKLDLVSLFSSRGLWIRQQGIDQFSVECPWSAEHTSGDDSAGIVATDKGRGLFPAFHCFHEHCNDRTFEDVLGFFGKEAVENHCRKKSAPSSKSERLVIDPTNPMGVARLYSEKEGVHLVHHAGDWSRWDGTKYVSLAEGDIRAALWKWLETASQETKGTLTPHRPTKTGVTGILEALKAVANLPVGIVIPGWIKREESHLAEDIIAFENGLLDVKSYVSNSDVRLISHTPNWFSQTCLPRNFDPEATCPTWHSFLEEVFEGDQERIMTLSQWFGYNLANDNRQQKFALFIGPPRSGKGTTMRVLTEMLGAVNVANPTFSSLGGRFGLAPLVDKLAAIIADGHIGRQTDTVAILERLKSIIGGDPQNVDRKNASERANVTMKVRFTIAVNEVPRFPEASAALKTRMLVFPFTQSFLGREDIDLGEKLQAEIKGITNWALNGLADLRKTGKFIQPKAGEEVVEAFTRLSSPVKAFLQDRCDIGKGFAVKCEDFRKAWEVWCESNGHEKMSEAVFGTKLRAAEHTIRRTKRRESGKQHYVYEGVRLN